MTKRNDNPPAVHDETPQGPGGEIILYQGAGGDVYVRCLLMAETIYDSADAGLPHMGLTAWKNGP